MSPLLMVGADGATGAMFGHTEYIQCYPIQSSRCGSVKLMSSTMSALKSSNTACHHTLLKMDLHHLLKRRTTIS